MNSDSCAPASPRSDPWVVAIAGSAGGIKAIGTVLAALPLDLPAAVVVVQHRSPTVKSYLESILMRQTQMPVVTATSGDAIVQGVVYVARPDGHLVVRPDKHFAYADGTRITHLLSSRVQTDDGAERALEVEMADGGFIRLAFRATALPEQLDGIAPGELMADALP